LIEREYHFENGWVLYVIRKFFCSIFPLPLTLFPGFSTRPVMLAGEAGSTIGKKDPLIVTGTRRSLRQLPKHDFACALYDFVIFFKKIFFAVSRVASRADFADKDIQQDYDSQPPGKLTVQHLFSCTDSVCFPGF